MSTDISAIMSASHINGMTANTTSALLSTSSGSLDTLVATSAGSASVASNGIDLVALSAQALVDEADSVTGLGDGVDLTDVVSELSPTAVAGLLDSTSDQAVLQAVFGNSSAGLLLGLTSA